MPEFNDIYVKGGTEYTVIHIFEENDTQYIELVRNCGKRVTETLDSLNSFYLKTGRKNTFNQHLRNIYQ